MEDEENIGVGYCMSELVDMALRQRIEPHGFDLSAKPLNFLDVDERSPLIVKLATTQHHA